MFFTLKIFLPVLIIFSNYCPLLALDPDRSIHQYTADKWTIEDGLPDNSIWSIVRTPDGYLWLTTPKGLVRFDGVKFSVIPYRKTAETANKKLYLLDSLLVDNEGNLWIGGKGHLTKYRYQTGQFTTFTKKHGLTGSHMYCMNQDMEGNLWLGFKECYLNRFARDKFTWFSSGDGLGGKFITSILADKEGNLLVSAYEGGIFKYRDGKFFKYEIKGLRNRIKKIYEDREGVLWIGTNKGVARVKDRAETAAVYTTRDGLSNDEVIEMMEDSDGNLWVATLMGLNRLRKDRSSGVVIEKIFESSTITHVFEDIEGNLWIATAAEGLRRLKDAKFTLHAASADEKMQGEFLWSIYADRRGDTWIGAHNGRLFRYRDDQCIESLEIPGFTSGDISAIEEDRNGNLWLGTTENGVFQKKGNTFINYTTRDGLALNNIIFIHTDSKNNLWFGTFDGLSRYSGGCFQSFKAPQGLAGKYVMDIYEDKSRNIWIATSRGIYVIKDGEVTKENISLYLSGTSVPCICPDRGRSSSKNGGDVLWIGTWGGGLKRYENGTFVSYTTARGICSDFIYKVIEDDREYLWLTSNIGVLRVSKNELDAFARGRIDNINCISFGISDGIKDNIFPNALSRNSLQKTRDGQLLFVTRKGITAVDPKKIKINKLPPPVIIEAVVYNDRAVKVCKNSEVFRGIKEVVFHFTSPVLSSPEKIRFKYKLEGYDRDWVNLPPGEKRMACYKSLAFGKYTFKVISCNSDGIWNYVGDSMTFRSSPYFYELAFFKGLILFIFLGLVVSGYFWYRKHAPRKAKAANNKNKNSSLSLNSSYVEECIKKLTYFMEVEKVYRDENISLQSLAKKCSLPYYQLSQILNERLNKSFSDFINTYRVEEAKKLLNDPEQSKGKIFSIALDVGFNTKSAFNSVFKRYTKMTPSEYRKRVLLGKGSHRTPRRGEP